MRLGLSFSLLLTVMVTFSGHTSGEVLNPSGGIIMIYGFKAGDDIEFIKLVDKLQKEGKEIFLASSINYGGATGPALRIGQKIRQLGLDVNIYGVCASSCADYFFMAGKRKILHDATIAFHGTPTATKKVVPKIFEQYMSSLGLSDVSWLGYKSVEQAKADVNFVLENEPRFFSDMGFDPTIFESFITEEDAKRLGCTDERAEFFDPTMKQLKSYGIQGVEGTLVPFPSTSNDAARFCQGHD